jgi:uncharacterized protein CbrC (UPF0167 family)
MKIILAAILITFLISCSNKRTYERQYYPEQKEVKTIDTIGVNQEVTTNNGVYTLRTWIRETEPQTITEWNFEMVSTKHPYDKSISGSFDSIKNEIHTEYLKATMLKNALDYKKWESEKRLSEIKEIIKSQKP